MEGDKQNVDENTICPPRDTCILGKGPSAVQDIPFSQRRSFPDVPQSADPCHMVAHLDASISGCMSEIPRSLPGAIQGPDVLVSTK